MLDIRTLGAQPYPHDSTDAILEAFRVATQQDRQPVHIPHGDWLVSRTIDVDLHQYLPLYGVGWGRPAYESSGHSEHSTRSVLMWGGAPGGTMFRCRGSGLTMRDMGLSGNAERGDSRAGVLVQYEMDPGYGSGGGEFHNVGFRHADTGLRMGQSVWDTNCDTTVLMRCDFYDMTNGMVTENNQSLGHHWTCVNGTGVGTMIRVNAGGHICWTGGACHYVGELLWLGPAAGQCNTYHYVLRDIRCECHPRTAWVRSAGGGNVLVEACAVISDEADPEAALLDLNGPVRCVARSCMAQGRMLGRLGRGAVLTTDNCYHSRIPSRAVVGSGRWVSKGCYGDPVDGEWADRTRALI